MRKCRAPRPSRFFISVKHRDRNLAGRTTKHYAAFPAFSISLVPDILSSPSPRVRTVRGIVDRSSICWKILSKVSREKFPPRVQLDGEKVSLGDLEGAS